MSHLPISNTTDHEHSRSGEKLALMVVFARPDDELLTITGTLAKYAGEGIHVALVTAERELAGSAAVPGDRFADTLDMIYLSPRETACSCRTAGIQRICLGVRGPAVLSGIFDFTVERLVRLIRELRPQVVVTFHPAGRLPSADQFRISQITTRAFQIAGDARYFPGQLRDGLSSFAPYKLYYTALPTSLITHWGLEPSRGIPDDQVTTVLDVSPYMQSKHKVVYCQQLHSSDYPLRLAQERDAPWEQEHFVLAASNLGTRPRHEKDLFAGLR